MKNISKQLEALVISWKNNIFLSAKTKLTLTYFAIVSLILFMFTLGVYVYFARNIEVDFEYEGIDEEYSTQIEHELADRARNRLVLGLITGDLIILFITLPAGYYLTDKTLRPINNMLNKQNRFISDAAHELRTPLTVMKTGIQSIETEKKRDVKKYRKLNAEVLDETNRLIELTNNLLFLAKNDSHKSATNATLVDLTALINKQVGLLKNYAKKNEISMQKELAQNITFYGNENELSQMIMNLLKNAIDYNNPGGSVHISMEKTHKDIVIRIKDSGIGISANEIGHIFDRFYQVDRSRSTKKGGSGLGLSIVKEIVKKHNGSVSISSVPNQGTEFEVKFVKHPFS